MRLPESSPRLPEDRDPEKCVPALAISNLLNKLADKLLVGVMSCDIEEVLAGRRYNGSIRGCGLNDSQCAQPGRHSLNRPLKSHGGDGATRHTPRAHRRYGKTHQY